MRADSFPVARLLSHRPVCDDMAFVKADGNASRLGGAELSGLGHREGVRGEEGTCDDDRSMLLCEASGVVSVLVRQEESSVEIKVRWMLFVMNVRELLLVCVI